VQQNIAPKMLIVDGKPSPCRCRTEGSTKIICEYCVQANLIIWERKEASGGTGNNRWGKLLNTFQKLDKERLAAILGVKAVTIYKWLRLKKIPKKYAQKFYRKFENGYLDKDEQKSV
jgi:hypothetical protein